MFKVFILGMLAICGWNSVLFSVGLWLLCYASQPFYAHDLVFILIYECMPSCLQTTQPRNLKNPKNSILLYWDYWDCVGLFSCSLGTIFGTNIFGVVAREWSWKHIFPWELIISLVLRAELKPTNLKDYFSPVFHSGY